MTNVIGGGCCSTNGFIPFTQMGGQPMTLNGELYGYCANSYAKTKLCKYSPTSSAVTIVADTSAHPSINDSPYGLGVLQQSGVDQALFFTSEAQGLFRKVFKVDTSGVVTQVADLVANADDGSAGGPGFGQMGFVLPTGPSSANEFYFSANVGTYSTNYARIFKIYPAP